MPRIMPDSKGQEAARASCPLLGLQTNNMFQPTDTRPT